MNSPITIKQPDSGSVIYIPMKIKKRGGRKEVLVPNGLEERLAKPDMNIPFAIAIARAFCWQEILDSGKYKSIREMAADLGVNSSYMNRLLRFTTLAPDIIEAVLDGRESDELTQSKLTGYIPSEWREQRKMLGFPYEE